MKVALYESQGKIHFVNLSCPETDSGEVLVRLVHGAVCGNDIHVLYEMPLDEFPFLPGFSGHECVGEVEKSRSPYIRRKNQGWCLFDSLWIR